MQLLIQKDSHHILYNRKKLKHLIHLIFLFISKEVADVSNHLSEAIYVV